MDNKELLAKDLEQVGNALTAANKDYITNKTKRYETKTQK